jgi:hypothetical protein
MSDPSDRRREDARRLADDLIDYAIYAPLGAAIAVAEELPELVRRGRERFGPRIALAQMLGKLAADSARRRAEAFVRRPADRPRADGTPAAAEPDAAAAHPARPAIPDFDALSAAEIVARLAALTPSELARVRSYETAHRARRTVLAKIAQLLGEQDR